MPWPRRCSATSPRGPSGNATSPGSASFAPAGAWHRTRTTTSALRSRPSPRYGWWLRATPTIRACGACSTISSKGSPRFAELWDDGRVAERRSSRKTVHHPQLGRLVLDCDALHLPDVDQRLIVYSAAPGSSDAEALALLRVVGLQTLEPTATGPSPRPQHR
jgi:MmyB-like transcription regulator ligand binding domain